MKQSDSCKKKTKKRSCTFQLFRQNIEVYLKNVELILLYIIINYYSVTIELKARNCNIQISPKAQTSMRTIIKRERHCV